MSLTERMNLTGFSESLLDIYIDAVVTGDPARVMDFLEEHKRVLLFHKLLVKAAILQHQQDSLPNIPWA